MTLEEFRAAGDSKVKFQGREMYLVCKIPGEESCPLTEPGQYESGEVSYAHIFNGVIKRFNEQIGTVADLEFVGPMKLAMSEEGFENFINGREIFRS